MRISRSSSSWVRWSTHHHTYSCWCQLCIIVACPSHVRPLKTGRSWPVICPQPHKFCGKTHDSIAFSSSRLARFYNSLSFTSIIIIILKHVTASSRWWWWLNKANERRSQSLGQGSLRNFSLEPMFESESSIGFHCNHWDQGVSVD